MQTWAGHQGGEVSCAEEDSEEASPLRKEGGQVHKRTFRAYQPRSTESLRCPMHHKCVPDLAHAHTYNACIG
eukprot:1160759-Pelagomonas_calceolata.AAC.5